MRPGIGFPESVQGLHADMNMASPQRAAVAAPATIPRNRLLSALPDARRQTVTTVAGAFQRARLIEYSYGRVTIVNRKGLERKACSCYAAIRSQFDRLL